LGDGKGGFTPTSTSPATGRNPQSVAVGDFKSDGIQDLAVANPNDNTVTILLGKGDGTFPNSQLVTLPSGTAPNSVTVADFNGDGFSDVVVAPPEMTPSTSPLTAPRPARRPPQLELQCPVQAHSQSSRRIWEAPLMEPAIPGAFHYWRP
jgi:hypothetical protein